MSASPAPFPGAASTDAQRPAADPATRSVAEKAAEKAAAKAWTVDLRELGRRAGTMREWDRTLPARPGWGVEMIGVPEGAPVDLHLRLESVMEGVLVSGTVDVPVTGQCARCLDPVEDTLELDVQELYAYEGSTTEATSGEDEVRRIEGDTLDLAPLVRDTVVLTLPLSPTCTPDCAGLCVDCGERLDDLPADHSHEVIDPRFAGLAARFADLNDSTANDADGAQPGSGSTDTEEN
ncbi:YceD family protein [Modestobacter altitudinis]|uniref:YceD family protein n=1 Tax=Modestobacter altitudinis TaxID=2213158 RepID=UPI00110C9FCD|nr:YceD family protein [Modestobacter altitudinis]